MLPNESLPYQPDRLAGTGITALEEVWPVLDALKARDKALVVENIVAVIGHDHVMSVEEVELLRTVCAILHCPLPPFAAHTVPA